MNWLRLLYWLGPWCDQEKSPNQIEKKIIPLQRGFDLWTYQHPKRQVGIIFVIPGLHPEGPADVRLDRFCRVLANAGILVGIPSLPTMKEVVMLESLLDDCKSSFQAFLEHTGAEKVGVFSISAASIAGFSLGSDPILSQRISFLHSFGGFSDWSEALLFAMSGEIEETGEKLEIDSLGLPVIFLNLIASFPAFLPRMRKNLAPRWKEFVDRTWEKPDMQDERKYRAVAEELVVGLEVNERTIFLKGCSIEEGGHNIVLNFLSVRNPIDWLEPESLLREIKVPVFLSHGRDDVVVPYPQINKLKEWVAEEYCEGVFVTGFYNHTGVVGFQRLLQIIPALPRELSDSIQMVRAIAQTGGILKQK